MGWGFAVLAAVMMMILIGWGWGSQGRGWGRGDQIAHMMPPSAGPSNSPASRTGAPTPPISGTDTAR